MTSAPRPDERWAGWFARFWSDITWGVWLHTEQAKFYKGGFYSTEEAMRRAWEDSQTSSAS